MSISLVRRTGVFAAIAFFALTHAAGAATCASQQLTVTPLQSSVFYIDAALHYNGSYVGYRIGNGAAGTRTGLWERLENFTGAVVTPAAGGATTPALPLDEIATAGGTPVYAYLKGSAETTSAQTHDVVIYQGRPGSGGVELCRQTQTITHVADVIKAAANKVDNATLLGNAELGGSFQIKVTGHTGQIGSGPDDDPGVVRLSPAVSETWPSAAFRLIAVSHKLPSSGSALTDWLWRGALELGDTAYEVTYTFRVVGPTTTPTPLAPVQNIASGTQVKHTDPGTLASLPSIPVVTSDATVTVGADTAGPYTPGQQVKLKATIHNGGSGAVSLDEIKASLPTGWTLVGDTATDDGEPLVDPYVSANTLRFVGPFSVPASSTRTIAFTATAGSTGTLAATGTLAGGQVDSTTDPSDDVPASITLSVPGEDPDPDPTPAAPAPGPLTSSGTATAPQQVTATVPSEGTLALLNGITPVTSLTVPGEGTYTVSGSELTFAPVLGFSGQATPVSYLVTDALAQTGTSTYTPTVLKPTGPTAVPYTSTGTGTASQGATVSVPADGTVTLLDALRQAVTTVTILGQGSYTLTGGEITFVPDLGYSGTADAVNYRVTDPYGQTADSTYTPTVNPPGGPSAEAKTSTGVGTSPQSTTITVPDGDTLQLTDGGEVPGQGTYALTGTTITFTPLFPFQGIATPVTYKVTDVYGQTATATYTPTVTPPTGPAAQNQETTGTGTAPQHASFTAPAGGGWIVLGVEHATQTLTVPGQGVYTRTNDGVTFVAVRGFSGSPTPAHVRVVDGYGQRADGTYQPHVLKPAPAAAPPRASSGTGTAPQHETLPIPDHGTVTLLDADGHPVTALTTDEGVYTLDPQTGAVSFAPRKGFAGTPRAASYRVTDEYGQTTDGGYTPTVIAPPAPTVGDKQSSGKQTETQARVIDVPEGSTLELLDEAGNVVTSLAIPGEGKYVLDAVQGVITFVPEPGFTGTPRAARYRVRDAYGQTAEGSYQPQVQSAAVTTCLSRRVMTIHWVVAAKAKLRTVSISIDGTRVARLTGTSRRVTVDLRGRPKGTAVVRISGRTVRGGIVVATRTYHPCTARYAQKPLKTLSLKAPR